MGDFVVQRYFQSMFGKNVCVKIVVSSCCVDDLGGRYNGDFIGFVVFGIKNWSCVIFYDDGCCVSVFVLFGGGLWCGVVELVGFIFE